MGVKEVNLQELQSSVAMQISEICIGTTTKRNDNFFYFNYVFRFVAIPLEILKICNQIATENKMNLLDLSVVFGCYSLENYENLQPNCNGNV